MWPLHTTDSAGAEHVFYMRVENEPAERAWTFRVFRTASQNPPEDFYEARVVRVSDGTAYVYTLSAHADWAVDVGIPAALLSAAQRIVGTEITSPPISTRVLMTLEEFTTWVEFLEQGIAMYDRRSRIFRFQGSN
jgi:phage baseplate assembly protein gpV